MNIMNMKRSREEWNPPATIEAGEKMKLELVTRLNDVEAQLAVRKKGGPACDGNYREDSETFFDWRGRAIHAKKAIIAELQRLNLWIKQKRRERTADRAASLGVDPKSPASMLLAAANIFQRMRSEGVDVDQDEIDVFDAIKQYLVQSAGDT
jgi:hypothetical protein